jgi:hypothetical protein
MPDFLFITEKARSSPSLFLLPSIIFEFILYNFTPIDAHLRF